MTRGYVPTNKTHFTNKLKHETIMKKIFLTVIMALIAVLTTSAQTSKTSKEKVYDVADVMPEYPGGVSEMMKFLRDNIKYPAEAEKRKEQGTVVVQFVVGKDGSLNDFNIVRHATPTLDNAAIEVIKSMPKWKPGTVKGKTVRVKYVLPVTYRLN